MKSKSKCDYTDLMTKDLNLTKGFFKVWKKFERFSQVHFYFQHLYKFQLSSWSFIYWWCHRKIRFLTPFSPCHWTWRVPNRIIDLIWSWKIRHVKYIKLLRLSYETISHLIDKVSLQSPRLHLLTYLLPLIN